MKFEAEWCRPCKRLDRELDQLSDLGLEIVRIDVDTSPGVTHLHNIRSVPTLIFLRGNDEVARLVGMHTAGAIRKIIGEIGP